MDIYAVCEKPARPVWMYFAMHADPPCVYLWVNGVALDTETLRDWARVRSASLSFLGALRFHIVCSCGQECNVCKVPKPDEEALGIKLEPGTTV